MQTSKKDLIINNDFFVEVIKTKKLVISWLSIVVNNVNGKMLNTPIELYSMPFLGKTTLWKTLWFCHMVQLNCYKTQKKHLLINAKIFVTSLGDMFQNIGLGSKLLFVNIMILHEELVEHFVCFVQNI